MPELLHLMMPSGYLTQPLFALLVNFRHIFALCFYAEDLRAASYLLHLGISYHDCKSGFNKKNLEIHPHFTFHKFCWKNFKKIQILDSKLQQKINSCNNTIVTFQSN